MEHFIRFLSSDTTDIELLCYNVIKLGSEFDANRRQFAKFQGIDYIRTTMLQNASLCILFSVTFWPEWLLSQKLQNWPF